jgi:hypothetical protein
MEEFLYGLSNRWNVGVCATAFEAARARRPRRGGRAACSARASQVDCLLLPAVGFGRGKALRERAGGHQAAHAVAQLRGREAGRQAGGASSGVSAPTGNKAPGSPALPSLLGSAAKRAPGLPAPAPCAGARAPARPPPALSRSRARLVGHAPVARNARAVRGRRRLLPLQAAVERRRQLLHVGGRPQQVLLAERAPGGRGWGARGVAGVGGAARRAPPAGSAPRLVAPRTPARRTTAAALSCHHSSYIGAFLKGPAAHPDRRRLPLLALPCARCRCSRSRSHICRSALTRLSTSFVCVSCSI